MRSKTQESSMINVHTNMKEEHIDRPRVIECAVIEKRIDGFTCMDKF